MRILISFLANLFFQIACALSSYLVLDVIISSIRFLFTGQYSSVLQMLISGEIIPEIDPFFGSWSISTPLQGFDYLLNNFINLQFSVSGRWIMLGISATIALVIYVLAGITGYEIRESSVSRPTDLSAEAFVAAMVMLFILLPTVMSPMYFLWFFI